MAQILAFYKYYKVLTMDMTASGANVASSQTNFPVCIHLKAFGTSPNMNATEKAHFFNGGNTWRNGKAVQFFASDDTTNLPFECEYYTSVSGAEEAVYWVRVPTVTGNSTTTIKVAYTDDADPGNQEQAAAVWSNSYTHIYHLGGTLAAAITADSLGTVNLLDTNTTDRAGQLGRGRDFNRVNTIMRMESDAADLSPGAGNITLTAWACIDTTAGAGVNQWLYANYGIVSNNLMFLLINDAKKLRGYLRDAGGNAADATSTGAITYGTNFHAGLVRDGTTARVYLNGAADGTATNAALGTITLTGGGLGGTGELPAIGDKAIAASPWYDTTTMIDGMLDEVRFASVARSADWIKLEYFTGKKTNWNGDGWITLAAEGSQTPTRAVYHSTTTPQMLSTEGCWCWFNDPRAVYYNGNTYFGYVASGGDVVVRSYNHTFHAVTDRMVLHSELEYDDHDNPTFLVRDSDKRIIAFYTKHASDDLIRIRVSTNPEDISAWDTETTLNVGQPTYASPIQLLSETNTPIYLFYRTWAGASAPTWCYKKSTDGGVTWGSVVTYWDPTTNGYVRLVQNGGARIDFAATDSHPQTGVTSLYHFYYQAGNFYKSDGTLIGAAGSVTVTPATATLVYNGDETAGNPRCWVWDCAVDGTGKPVIAYTTYPTTTDHRYNYARWTGTTWDKHQIVASGSYIVDDTIIDAGQVYYSGGVVLDRADPQNVYASVQEAGIFNIYRYVTTDGGTSFARYFIAGGSHGKHNRPIPIHNAPSDLKVLWLYGHFASYVDFDMAVLGHGAGNPSGGQVIAQSADRGYSDDFNRANGALGANWTDVVGSHSVLTNRASQAVSTSEQLSAYSAMADAGDVLVTAHAVPRLDTSVPSVLATPGVGVRYGAGPNYYLIQHTNASGNRRQRIYKVASGVLGSAVVDAAASGLPYKLGALVTGGASTRIRVWLRIESASPAMDYTDVSSPYQTGKVAIRSISTSATAANVCEYDELRIGPVNIIVTNIPTGYYVTIWDGSNGISAQESGGSVTFDVTTLVPTWWWLLTIWNGNPNTTGSPVGYRFVKHAYTYAYAGLVILTLSGTLTSVGTLGKWFSRAFAGALATSATLSKIPQKLFSGTLATSAGALKQVNKRVAGTLATSAGTLVKQINKRVTGTLATSAGALKQNLSRNFAGTLATAGVLSKQVRQLLAGTLTSAGTFAKTNMLLVAVSGTLSTAGTLTNQVNKALAGTLVTSAGSVVKRINKSIAGALATSAVLTVAKTAFMSLAGTLATGGTLAKQIDKTVAGTLTTAGNLTKQVRRILSGVLSTAGGFVKQFIPAGGTIVYVVVSGTLATAGVLVKQSSLHWSGTLATASTLAKQISLHVSGILATAGILTSAQRAYQHTSVAVRRVYQRAIMVGRQYGVQVRRTLLKVRLG